MPFLTAEELKTAIYAYQIDQITEGDDDIVEDAIATAQDEVFSYLRPGPKGLGPAYDTTAIFATVGTGRSPMLLAITKSIAVWHLAQLCNAELIYEQTKERYDRAIDWLEKVNRGDVLPNLPRLVDATLPGGIPTSEDDYLIARMGSRPKFNHE